MKKTFVNGFLLLVAFALLVASAGCGSGAGGAQSTSDSTEAGGSQSTSDGSGSSLVERPAATRHISEEIEGFEKSLREENCKSFQVLVHSTVRGRLPAHGARPIECRESEVSQFARRIPYPITDSQEYGTAALMEMAKEGRREYTFWIIDGDDFFRFNGFEGVFEKQIGAKFEDRAGSERVAKSFVRAVAEHNCAALLKTIHPTSRLVYEGGSPEAICRRTLDGKYFAPAIQATPNPKIEVMGGTPNFAFIGISTTKAYFTLVMRQSPPGPMRVFDVMPNTPVEDVERPPGSDRPV